MSTASAPVANGNTPHFQIVSRLDGVPVVHDSVVYAQSLVNSTQLTAQLYNIALGVASKSYDLATPVLSRTKPILESADGLAVATFDRAEATFPYPFKTPTQDLVGVKQAKGIYDARLAPMFHQASPVIADVINKTAQINSAIGARAHASLQSSQELSVALIEQLRTLAEHGKDLPGNLMESVGKATNDISDIVFAKEKTIGEKSNKLGAYVVDQVKPIVDEIYNYVIGAKKTAQTQASKAVDQVDGVLSN